MAAVVIAASPGLAQPAPAPDYAREARWADEVAPSVMVGEAVWIRTPDRDRVLGLYTPAQGTARGAVVIVHGLGVQPDFGVIGELRAALAERGFTTLSLQMPVLGVDALPGEYAALYPVAGDRIDAAVAWLRARGATPIAVVAHSMGAAMSNAWLARAQHADVAAFVAIGMGVPFAASRLPPALDIVAEHDLAPVRASAPLRSLALARDCSSARVIPAADHFLNGHGAEVADIIAPFLQRAFSPACQR